MDPKNPIQFDNIKAWEEIRPYYDALFDLREKRERARDREHYWDWFANRLMIACLATALLLIFMDRWMVISQLCASVVWGLGVRNFYLLGRELYWAYRTRRLCRIIDKINVLHLQRRHQDD